MRGLAASLAPLLISAFVASSAIAQANFTELGTLPGTEESIATAISADGNWVVGYSTTAGSPDKAWRWSAFTGMLAIGDLPGGADFSFATGVSSDGSVVVGVSSSSLGQEAFSWTEAGRTQWWQ
jgi:probable HAF family extracellular repeat protein